MCERVSYEIVRIQYAERMEDFGWGPIGRNTSLICDGTGDLPLKEYECNLKSDEDLGFGAIGSKP